jgi:hypothetical protein
MECYGCGFKTKNMKELAAHLTSNQECVDKIEEENLNNPNSRYANPVFKKQQLRKGEK